MIQRIQTVYLLLVVALLIISMYLPLGSFIDMDLTVYKFNPLGVTINSNVHSTWGLFSILLLSAIIAFFSIFLFKNRVLQLRMTVFNTIILIGYYITFTVFLFSIKNDLEANFQIHWALCLPLISIILNYLAIRAIGKDEVLVKAADRLR